MALYETVFIARQDIPAQEAEELADKFSSIVADNGGTVDRHEYWGLRNLAYRIKKNRKGHYTLMNIDAPAGAIGELERNMRINEDVLRYMTIRVDELDENPSIMLTNRGPRDSRDRGRDRDRNQGREAQDGEAAVTKTAEPESATEAAAEGDNE